MLQTTQPIILIGAARSGTKFLRDVLAAQPGICAVPYDVNYVWRFGIARDMDDALDPAALTDAKRAFIRRQLGRLSGAGPGQAMLEKTVSNTLRVPFVDAVYPDARYIHLVRDGRDVTESAIRQWTAPPDWPALVRKLRGLPLANIGYLGWFTANFVRGRRSGRGGGRVWGPRFPGSDTMVATLSLPEICATQWVQSVTRARADLAALPGSAERVHTIRYEDLVADPAALAALVAWLGIEDGTAVQGRYAASLRRSDAKPWQMAPVETQSAIARIADPTLAEFGYLP